MLAAEETVARGDEVVVDALEDRRDSDSFCEYNGYGSMNFTLSFALVPYASGCSLCGTMRSSRGTNELARVFKAENFTHTAEESDIGVLWRFKSKAAAHCLTILP